MKTNQGLHGLSQDCGLSQTQMTKEKQSHQGILSRRLLMFKNQQRKVWLMLWCPRGILAQQPHLLLRNYAIGSLKVILKTLMMSIQLQIQIWLVECNVPRALHCSTVKGNSKSSSIHIAFTSEASKLRLQIFWCDLFWTGNKDRQQVHALSRAGGTDCWGSTQLM